MRVFLLFVLLFMTILLTGCSIENIESIGNEIMDSGYGEILNGEKRIEDLSTQDIEGLTRDADGLKNTLIEFGIIPEDIENQFNNNFDTSIDELQYENLKEQLEKLKQQNNEN